MTTRSLKVREQTTAWINRCLPGQTLAPSTIVGLLISVGVFESICFSGDIMTWEANNCGEIVEKRHSKGEVCAAVIATMNLNLHPPVQICRELAASLLIDDSVENVLGCVTARAEQTPALLFGDYEWGKRASNAETAEDMMSFDKRKQHELLLGRDPEWWKQDTIQLPEGVWRVKDWSEALLWLQRSGEDVNTQSV